jgi:hypothetical protein
MSPSSVVQSCWISPLLAPLSMLREFVQGYCLSNSTVWIAPWMQLSQPLLRAVCFTHRRCFAVHS